MDSCPKELEPYAIAHRKKIEEQDYLQWQWWGSYGLSAVCFAVDHCLNGKKARSKYLDRQIFADIEEPQGKYKESREECAVYEMKQRIKMLREHGLPESPD